MSTITVQRFDHLSDHNMGKCSTGRYVLYTDLIRLVLEAAKDRDQLASCLREAADELEYANESGQCAPDRHMAEEIAMYRRIAGPVTP